MSSEKETDQLPEQEPETGQAPEAGAETGAETEAADSRKKGKRKKGEDELSMARQEAGEMKEKYLRLYAEYDNFRRRTAKEKLELSRAGAESLMRELLTVLDDTERAVEAISRTEGNKEVVEGVELIRNKLFKTLEKNGLVPMDSQGKDFDTDHHEALTQIPASDESLKGKVIDVIEKGYFLHDKVLRFAKVVVGA